MINVTRTAMPSLDDFNLYLHEIWDSSYISNDGILNERLEGALREYLKVPYISLLSSGTMALMAAIKVLNLKGGVITSPFSYAATTNAIAMCGLEPIFVDIDPTTFNLDPKKIEAMITNEISGIIPVHTFGNPCDTVELKKVGDKYNLKIIYDAAHAFGVQKHGESILNNGNLSILSFHATKVFSTCEGGAVISPTLDLKNQVDRFKNFGFSSELNLSSIGINGKLSEIHAAFGLAHLKDLDERVSFCSAIDRTYREELEKIKGIALWDSRADVQNFGYFPILIEENYPLSRDELYFALKNRGINAKRYFYPLISEFAPYKHLPSANPINLPFAHGVANRILCLPIYFDLTLDKVKEIALTIEAFGR